MAFTVTETDKGDYIRLTLVGELDIENMWPLHHSVAGAAVKLQQARFLLDITELEGRPDFLGSIQAVQSIPREIMGRIKKVAILDDIRNRTSAIIHETVIANRGLNVKFFFDEGKAVRWLLE